MLGLWRDTEKDEISVNVKINYGEKKGAYVQDSTDPVAVLKLTSRSA